MACPICKKATVPTDATWPFCSERCRTVDLGSWLGEGYGVPAMPSLEELEGNGEAMESILEALGVEGWNVN